MMGKKAPAASVQAPNSEVAKLYTWVKALEIKINKLTREFDLLKNDSIRRNNNLKKDVKHFSEELINLKDKQSDNDQKIGTIISELRRTAGVEQVDVLKKYIEFWNPMNFVTQNDLDRLFEEKKTVFFNSMKNLREKEELSDTNNVVEPKND